MSKWNWKHVYAMLANDGKIKIGISKDVLERVKAIQNTKEIKIIDVFETDMCSNPHTIERMCHELFKNSHVFGEWFKIDFDVAIDRIEDIFRKYAKFEEVIENSDAIKQIFDNSQERDKDEMICAMCEVMLSQNKQITELSKNIEELSKTTKAIMEMFKEMVFLLDEKFKSER